MKLFFIWSNSPQWAMAPSFTRFLDHTQRCTTVGRTSLDEWSPRLRDLYLTKPNTHNRQTSMPPVGFEPTVSTGERPQTYANCLPRSLSYNRQVRVAHWQLTTYPWSISHGYCHNSALIVAATIRITRGRLLSLIRPSLSYNLSSKMHFTCGLLTYTAHGCL